MASNKTLKKIKYSLRFLPDKWYIQLYYFMKFKKFCDFKNPKTFNEKLQWLKLYDRRAKYAQMVDKYEAKKYVANIIGEEYIIPTLGVWDSFDDIDFDTLPPQFVLKCTHDSEGVVIVKDKSKLDIEATKKILTDALKQNFFYIAREYPYKNLRPRIIAEKYMEDELSGELKDYKIHCFNGEPRMTLVCSERFSEQGLCEDFFDNVWKHLDLRRPNHPNAKNDIPCPQNFGLMKELASQLAKNIPFVRIDFYEINGKVYFGEITFYPVSGFGKFTTEETDEMMGEWLTLPKE